MSIQSFRLIALLLALVVPGLTPAQGYRSDVRAEIRVLNDWEDEVNVTILAERREELIKRSWTIESGASSYLSTERNGREFRIRVRGTDRIKIRDDARGVRIADVARYQDGHWFARVRDIYQAQRATGPGSRRSRADLASSDFEPGIDRPGNDFQSIQLDSANPEICRSACERNSRCMAYTYVNPGVQGPNAVCYLKNPIPQAMENSCCTSGVIR